MSHVTQCAEPSCPAYFDPERGGIGDYDNPASGWCLPAGTNRETLPPHTHRLSEAPNWSPEASDAFAALADYLAKRSIALNAQRMAIARLLLVPADEAPAVSTEIKRTLSKHAQVAVDLKLLLG